MDNTIPQFLKVKENPDIVRDRTTKAIINTNKENYLKARQRKADRVRDKQRLDDVENSVSEIKIMMKQILQILKG